MAIPTWVATVGWPGQSNPCYPGSELWVTPGGAEALTRWLYAGVCPTTGVVTCGDAINNSGQSIRTYLLNSMGTIYWNSANCFQDGRLVGYTGGPTTGNTGGNSSSGGGFEFTSAQQAEVYTSLALVFGVLLAAMTAIWGVKQILRLLNIGVGVHE